MDVGKGSAATDMAIALTPPRALIRDISCSNLPDALSSDSATLNQPGEPKVRTDRFADLQEERGGARARAIEPARKHEMSTAVMRQTTRTTGRDGTIRAVG